MDNAVKYFKALGKLDFASSFTSYVRRNLQAQRDKDVTPPPSEKEKSQANIIEELTRQVQNLALIVERERAGCRSCGRKGHSEDFCRAPECRFCRKIGYTEDRCFSNSNNPQRQSPRAAYRQQVDQRRVSFGEDSSNPNASVRILPRASPGCELGSPNPNPQASLSIPVPPPPQPNVVREPGSSTQLLCIRRQSTVTLLKIKRELKLNVLSKDPVKTSKQMEPKKLKKENYYRPSILPPLIYLHRPSPYRNQRSWMPPGTSRALPQKNGLLRLQTLKQPIKNW